MCNLKHNNNELYNQTWTSARNLCLFVVFFHCETYMKSYIVNAEIIVRVYF